MNTFDSHQEKTTPNFRSVAGIVLILAGIALFLDRYLNTGWLSLMVLPSIGMFTYLLGARQRHVGMIMMGGILAGVGAGSLAAYSRVTVQQPFLNQMGLLAIYTGIGWTAATAATVMVTNRPQWWGLLPSGGFSALGAMLLFTGRAWGDYVLYLALGIGIPFLVWGLVTHIFGLTIPGALIVGAGMGVYMGWYVPQVDNTLVRTGIMLVWFALGWGLITLSGRIIRQKYVWWPLIPGGILAMVGWGLYIGGDSDNALGFISNTGSIALMIFGLYLLLMRKGIHH